MCRASVAAVRLAGSVALKDPTHIRLQNGLIRLQACFPNRVQIWSLADVASIPRMTRNARARPKHRQSVSSKLEPKSEGNLKSSQVSKVHKQQTTYYE